MQIAVRTGYLRTAFFGRLNEWFFSIVLLMWGVVLLMPQATFDGPAYSAFRLVINEDLLGWMLTLGGAIRLAVLFANGFWRPMYYVRAWMALTSMMVWVVITQDFYSSSVFGTWLALYPAMAVFEGVNVFRSMNDAAAAERQARQSSAS